MPNLGLRSPVVLRMVWGKRWEGGKHCLGTSLLKTGWHRLESSNVVGQKMDLDRVAVLEKKNLVYDAALGIREFFPVSIFALGKSGRTIILRVSVCICHLCASFTVASDKNPIG